MIKSFKNAAYKKSVFWHNLRKQFVANLGKTFQPPYSSTPSMLLTVVDIAVTLMQVAVANEHLFVLMSLILFFQT